MMTQDGGAEPIACELLRYSDFERRTGESFPLRAGDKPLGLALTLVFAEPLPASPRDGGGFRLEFEGAAQPILPQAIYGFEIDGAVQDIFIVPLGPGRGGMAQYEAVFF